MTPAQLAEIEKLHPRPWRHMAEVGGDKYEVCDANQEFVCVPSSRTAASLIVAAVNAYKPTEDRK